MLDAAADQCQKTSRPRKTVNNQFGGDVQWFVSVAFIFLNPFTSNMLNELLSDPDSPQIIISINRHNKGLIVSHVLLEPSAVQVTGLS